MNGNCEGCKNETCGVCGATVPPMPCWEAWLGDEDKCVMYDEAE
jgi:hypothetical protein